MATTKTKTLQDVVYAPKRESPPASESLNFFPHLPPHQDPTTGIVSKLPSLWIPYAQLMRLDRPAGLYAFYFPFLIGLMYAACISPVPVKPLAVLKFGAILLLLNVLLRGASCTWNDNFDQEFDRRVERCRHRAIARGAVSTRNAHIFTAAQLAAMCPLMSLFPAACTPHMLAALVLFFVYPLMKRVTFYSQVFLGFPVAWAIVFSVAALGIDPLQAGVRGPTLALCAANIFWTITYDTIYAHQDVADDAKAGVKSMALRFENSTKIVASVLSVAQVLSLALVGIWAGFSSIYFVGTVGGVAAAMAYYIYDVDLKRPESCGAWFHDQMWLVGSGFLAGLTGGYYAKKWMV